MPVSPVPEDRTNDKPPVVNAELVSDREWPASPPVRLREILAVFGIVVMADITIYRGAGFAGIAALLCAVSLLLWFGKPERTARKWITLLIMATLWLLAARIVWCGSTLRAIVGAGVLLTFAVVLSGLHPYVAEVLGFPARMLLGGTRGIVDYPLSLARLHIAPTRSRWLSVTLPLVTVVLFSLLFVLANPDLLSVLGQWADQVLQNIRTWVLDRLPPWLEVLFWMVTAWIAIGMLRPLSARPLFDEEARTSVPSDDATPVSSSWYPAVRNTLVGVIVLFALYLIFEFQTLWFRNFPKGFYYSGYAHQGAAWLTVALALATVVLSLAFRGQLLRDARVRTLRQMAWIWSLQNMLLAVAVYHRMFIYIGFNGWTPMRMVGLYGISAVVIGFLLVLWKIARNHSFLWLAQRHAWTVAWAVYLFALTPIDAIVTQRNVQRILAGDPAPSVQISVHPISAEGVTLLEPLLECRDAVIREGVRAFLAERHEQARRAVERQHADSWTAYQCADRWVLDRLDACQEQLARYQDASRRQAALDTFHKYAYQWY